MKKITITTAVLAPFVLTACDQAEATRTFKTSEVECSGTYTKSEFDEEAAKELAKAAKALADAAEAFKQVVTANPFNLSPQSYKPKIEVPHPDTVDLMIECAKFLSPISPIKDEGDEQ